MDMPHNTFKAAIKDGKLQIGLWCTLCSHIAAEVVATPASTGCCSTPSIRPTRCPTSCATCRRCSVAPPRRSCGRRGTTSCLIKRYLDIGAQTLLLPYVQNAEEARRAVAATRYPPAGIRGVTGVGRAAHSAASRTT